MSVNRRFFDTNVLLYLLSADQAKGDRAETLIASGGIVSVQVLNEFASVATRKLRMLIPVVATAREAGCKILYTEDIQDGMVIVGVTIHDPFRHEGVA